MKRQFLGMRSNRWIALTLFMCLVLFFMGCGTDDHSALENYTLRIAHFNDSHSHIEAGSQTIYIDGVKTTVDIGGYARLVTKAKEMRAESANFLMLNAGDVFQGTLYYTQYKGLADLELLEMMRVDAMVPGNHEFDNGNLVLADYLKKATFSIVSSNIDYSNAPELAPYVVPYIIKNINGVDVGIFGLTLEDTPTISSPGDDLVFENEIEIAKQMVKTLSDQGIEIIVALTHMGYDMDIKLAESVNDIDIVVGGHSHTLLGDFSEIEVDSEGNYPTIVKNPQGKTVVVTQAWNHALAMGDISVTFDTFGYVKSYAGYDVMLLGDNFTQDGKPVDDATRKTIMNVVDSMPALQIVTPDPTAEARIKELSAPIDELKKTVVGSALTDLWHTRVPGSTHPTAGVLPNGSLIAPHVCDAMLWKANEIGMGVDIALQNAGGVRIDIPKGDITVSEVYTLMPFGNTLTVIELTGDKIKKAIADGAYRAASGAGSGAFPYVAGMRYTYNYNGGVNSELVSAEVFKEGAWTPILDGMVYKLTTNSFTASGGDNYTALLDNISSYDTGFIDAEVFQSYLEHVKVLDAPTTFNVTYLP